MLFALLFSYAMAAIPTDSAKTSISAEELLSMPAANRAEVARFQKDEKLIAQLWQMAFDTKKDMGQRWKSLTLASQMKKESAKENLDKALQSQDWFMRNAALVAYKEVFPDQAVAVATKLLNDKALVVRSAAIEAFPNQLSADLRDRLWEEMYQSYNFRKKQGLWVRSLILQKLAQTPQSKEAPLFAKALREEDNRLHAPAIAALEKISSVKLGAPKLKSEKLRALWLDWSKKNI